MKKLSPLALLPLLLFPVACQDKEANESTKKTLRPGKEANLSPAEKKKAEASIKRLLKNADK